MNILLTKGESFMRCALHPDREATGICVDCGKALCQECSNKFKPVLCPDCAEARNKQELKKVVTVLCISIIFFIIAWNIEGSSGFSLSNRYMAFRVLAALFIAGVPWGWITLNKLTPNVFLVLPGIGWIMYFITKLILSFIIGIFAMIIKNIYYIYKLVKYLKTEKYIKSHL